MAGPNPYPPYSFLESRKFSGKSWLICEDCRRYTPLILDDERRDTRFTTFSCSRCGGEGKRVFEDPHKQGLEPDVQRRPARHRDAAARVLAAAAEARAEDERQRLAEKERRWRRAQRPQEAPKPVYRLKPFPVQTFADIATWGLSVEVKCDRCHRAGVPLEVGANLKPLPLLGTTFRCTNVIPGNVLTSDRVCGGAGQLWMSPAENGGSVPDAPFIGVCCHHRDAHTGLEIQYLVVNKPPWQAVQPRGDERFSCPGCGGLMHHSWATVDKRPLPRW